MAMVCRMRRWGRRRGLEYSEGDFTYTFTSMDITTLAYERNLHTTGSARVLGFESMLYLSSLVDAILVSIL